MFPIDSDAILGPITTIHDSGYQWGALQVIKFNPLRTDIFPEPFLYQLYCATRDSGRSHLGSLPSLFCGMTNLTADAICAYLLQQQVIIMGEWRAASSSLINPDDPLPDNFDELCQPQFVPLGYMFPTTFLRSVDGQRNSLFAGYTFFQSAWRTQSQLVLTYLGLAYLFCEFRLVNLHGVRYADNKLTARWMERFGFRDCGTMPNFLIERQIPGNFGRLVDATFSTLERADLEEQLRQVFRQLQVEEAASDLLR